MGAEIIDRLCTGSDDPDEALLGNVVSSGVACTPLICLDSVTTTDRQPALIATLMVVSHLNGVQRATFA